MKIKVFTSFSGYDSQCMALDRLHSVHPEFSYELVGWSEIDKNAIHAHNAVYPQWRERNYGDISKVDWANVPDFDLFTYSFPCQAVSSAGLQKGLSEGSGTTSSLLWECRRAITAKHPTFMLMENVKALTQKKFMPDFGKWIDFCKSEGYVNFWKVLNAKDFGVPQNRERVFMVSIHKSAVDKYPDRYSCGIHYEFPCGFPLAPRLKDVLETYRDGKVLDEKYYLTDAQIDHRIQWTANTTSGHAFKPREGGDTGFAVSAGSQRTDDNWIKEYKDGQQPSD